MKIVFKALSISFLLILGLASALASPEQRQGWREEMRAVHMQQMWERQQKPQGEGLAFDKSGQRGERHRGHEAGGFESNGTDDSKRSGRMSPEERRALRRQINEAGRDIYAPPNR